MANGTTKLTKNEMKALRSIRAAERRGTPVVATQAEIDALWAKNLIRRTFHGGPRGAAPGFYCLRAALELLGEVK